MLFDNLRRLRSTLAFRLTIWYAAIFTVSSLLAFLFFYLQIASILRERTDEDLLDDIKEFSALLAAKGIDEVKQTMIVEAKTDGEKDVFYRLLNPDGKELDSSELFFWGQLSVNPAALERIAKDGKPVLETLTIEGRRHKARTVYAPIAPGAILQIGESLEDNDEFLAKFRQIFGGTITGVMVLAGLLGWFMAKRALKNVEEVTRTARAISASDLEQRVPVEGQADEIGRLAATFNEMLDRIDTTTIRSLFNLQVVAEESPEEIQRRRLAAKAKGVGRKLLAEVVTIVTPETLLRWHRKLIAEKASPQLIRDAFDYGYEMCWVEGVNAVLGTDFGCAEGDTPYADPEAGTFDDAQIEDLPLDDAAEAYELYDKREALKIVMNT